MQASDLESSHPRTTLAPVPAQGEAGWGAMILRLSLLLTVGNGVGCQGSASSRHGHAFLIAWEHQLPQTCISLARKWRPRDQGEEKPVVGDLLACKGQNSIQVSLVGGRSHYWLPPRVHGSSKLGGKGGDSIPGCVV